MSERLIRDFCEAWSRKDIEELLDYFSEDAVYHNMPLEPAQGKEAIRKVLNLFVPMAKEISFDIKNLATRGRLIPLTHDHHRALHEARLLKRAAARSDFRSGSRPPLPRVLRPRLLDAPSDERRMHPGGTTEEPRGHT